MNKPVLFIVFNRFDTAQKVFEQIRLAQPPRLYIASDGARENVENEKAIVENIRKWILENIDWDCEVKTLFREENLGCAKNIAKTISWFFENEPAGIILEDDCCPSQSFFKFCDEALDKYKDNKKIWSIDGCNSVDMYLERNNSIYASKCMNCWGWATWADRWQYFNADLTTYNPENIIRFLDKIPYQIYWLRVLYRYNHTSLNSWYYPWALNIMEHQGLSIFPDENLISNIGFDGVHYKNRNKKSKILTRLKNSEIENINLPDEVLYDNKFDNLIFKHFYRINSFMVKFILRFLSEIITFNFAGESTTILMQVFNIKGHKNV